MAWCWLLSRRYHPTGSWFFQSKTDSNELPVEVSPAAFRSPARQGANHPFWQYGNADAPQT